MFIAAPEKLPKFGAFSTLGTALVLDLGLVAPLVGQSRGLPLYALLVERLLPPGPGIVRLPWKQDRVAPFVADPPQRNSSTTQSHVMVTLIEWLQMC